MYILGLKCETDIDECSSLPCLNGGICRDKVGGFTCECSSGYTGKGQGSHLCNLNLVLICIIYGHLRPAYYIVMGGEKGINLKLLIVYKMDRPGSLFIYKMGASKC